MEGSGASPGSQGSAVSVSLGERILYCCHGGLTQLCSPQGALVEKPHCREDHTQKRDSGERVCSCGRELLGGSIRKPLWWKAGLQNLAPPYIHLGSLLKMGILGLTLRYAESEGLVWGSDTAFLMSSLGGSEAATGSQPR